MVVLKRIVGFGFFMVGLSGCIFYLPSALLRLDASLGSRLMSLVIKYVPALTEIYNEQAAQAFFGVNNSLTMMAISIVVLILGLFLAN